MEIILDWFKFIFFCHGVLMYVSFVQLVHHIQIEPNFFNQKMTHKQFIVLIDTSSPLGALLLEYKWIVWKLSLVSNDPKTLD